jgi:hypothetical protein
MDVAQVENRDRLATGVENRHHIVAQSEAVLFHQISPGSNTERQSTGNSEA